MTLAALVGRVLRAAASDITPLRESVPFRRLFAGQTVSQIGTQVTRIAVPLQVYAITRSSLDVGLIGLAGFVPLVVFGLYGGAIADAVDRRKLVLLTSTGTVLVSVVLLVQAALGINRVSVLFACVAVQAAFAAVDSPARRAIIPQVVRAEKLPAANTLAYGSMQLTVIAGPLLAGIAVGTGGFGWAYAIDVASFAGAFYAAVRLPPLPPGEGAQRAGLASVIEGLRFLGRRPVLLMTFLADLNAMIFGMPAALFPALAQGQYGGGARTAGLLYAAPAVGAVVVDRARWGHRPGAPPRARRGAVHRGMGCGDHAVRADFHAVAGVGAARPRRRRRHRERGVPIDDPAGRDTRRDAGAAAGGVHRRGRRRSPPRRFRSRRGGRGVHSPDLGGLRRAGLPGRHRAARARRARLPALRRPQRPLR
ncbi:MAG TPA: MFS transporter [Pseudonocardiaceae bacterium]